MIRVTVELVSAVSPSRNRVLGIAEIANNGERTVATGGQQGDYLVKLDDPEESYDFAVTLSKMEPKQTQTWKRGEVRGFDRKRKGAWDLLYLALRAIVGGRNS
jgi:hypothetical protein